MRPRSLASFAVSVALLSACSGAPATESTPAPQVWGADSTGFAFTVYPGGAQPSPKPAGCSAVKVIVTYDRSSEMLTLKGCASSNSGDLRLWNVSHALSSDDASRLAGELSVLAVVPASTECGADAPTLEFKVLAGSSAKSYSGDFYSGCQHVSPVAPPFLSQDALSNLFADLQKMLGVSILY